MTPAADSPDHLPHPTRRLDFGGARAWIALCALASAAIVGTQTQAAPGELDLHPSDTAVIATGNEWLALPEIRPTDGALLSFNALSMKHNGLLQVTGGESGAVIEPILRQRGSPLKLNPLAWRLKGYWIPEGHTSQNDLHITLTYLAPNGFRAAVLALQIDNQSDSATQELEMGFKTRFGSIQRVTYLPVALGGERRVAPAPWVGPGEVYSWVTSDTEFAFAFIHPTMTGQIAATPTTLAPETLSVESVRLKPHERKTVYAILSIGQEEFSAAHAARALKEHLFRDGFETLLNQQIEWCLSHTRRATDPNIDAVMNRNFLFSRLYAWGRTIDTEQWVGVTSRSPRYYVAAAYWDRDAMVWSFPALLDTDPAFAAIALDHAFTTQLRNTGTHSRFINGSVLEDGFQLDEATAPLLALGQYLDKTHDVAFLNEHWKAVLHILATIEAHRDANTHLYWSMQDAQDEYQALPFITVDNAMVVQAWRDVSQWHQLRGEAPLAADAKRRAEALAQAMHTRLPATPPEGGDAIWPSASNGLLGQDRRSVFTEIPPASQLKLVQFGVDTADSARFKATYAYLHSRYAYSYQNTPYGFPGSYRLPFSASWVLADELLLPMNRERALATILESPWDNGIITEGVDPHTAQIDPQGRAFATAAGYVAHALCTRFCLTTPPADVPTGARGSGLVH